MMIFKWMGIFAGYPWLILIPIALFSYLAFAVKSRLTKFTALAWLIYGAYELLMYAHVLCHGDCDLRLELAFIYPLLLLLSIATLVATGSRSLFKG